MKKFLWIGIAIVAVIIILLIIYAAKKNTSSSPATGTKKSKKGPTTKQELLDLLKNELEIKADEQIKNTEAIKSLFMSIKKHECEWVKVNEKEEKIIRQFPECPMFEPTCSDDIRVIVSPLKDQYFKLLQIEVPALSAKIRQLKDRIKELEHEIEAEL